MTPGAHFLISWLSTVEVLKKSRERTLVTLTGFAPDLDGFGIIIDKFTGTTELYIKYHHYLGHSILSALILASLAAVLSKSQKLIVWLLSFIVVHLHIACDVIGSKSPDGYQWPIYYLYPFKSDFELTWSGQWELNAWPNQLTIVILLLTSIYYSVTKKITFFEVFGERLNKEALNMYNKYIRKNKNA